jgi:dethiobiotin synthetase
MREAIPRLTRPGLFVTGTDTGVGKTAVSCGILAALRRRAATAAWRVGPGKPFASGVTFDQHDPTQPVQEDITSLRVFSSTDAAASTVCPQAFLQPAAPAAAAEAEARHIDWPAVGKALQHLNDTHDALLIEGIGGVLVPLDPADASITVRELIAATGFPTIVVCRAYLGTLNHTALTVEALRNGGVEVVGLVMNHTEAEITEADDPTLASNAHWLEQMTGVPVLARVPHGAAGSVDLPAGRIDPAMQAPLDAVAWETLFAQV